MWWLQSIEGVGRWAWVTATQGCLGRDGYTRPLCSSVFFAPYLTFSARGRARDNWMDRGAVRAAGAAWHRCLVRDFCGRECRVLLGEHRAGTSSPRAQQRWVPAWQWLRRKQVSGQHTGLSARCPPGTRGQRPPHVTGTTNTEYATPSGPSPSPPHQEQGTWGRRMGRPCPLPHKPLSHKWSLHWGRGESLDSDRK